MLFLVYFATSATIAKLNDVMDFDDIVHMDVPNMLDSVGVGEQLQLDIC
jgi:hypothetical protein